MPDHLHALLSFPPEPTAAMSRVIGDWKKFLARTHGLIWQEGYFDHRPRNAAELQEKAAYIRNNPVVKNLCVEPAAWPWVLDASNRD